MSNNADITLVCSTCHARYSTDVARWRCDCGAPLSLDFAPRYSREAIYAGEPSLWRYQDALPLAQRSDLPPMNLGERMTPLRNMEGPWGNAWFKMDYLMPSGSYKDRGTAVMMQQLRLWGVEELIEDSSGNAGASVAAYATLAGIHARIFIPESASEGKAVQIALSGAELVRVPGTREQTTEAAFAAAENTFYASHNWSPWFIHGVKTLALEIWEQLGWRAPQAVVVPVGNGSLVLGLYAGFCELLRAKHIDTLPRIIAVQASACAPLAEAFATGKDEPVLLVKGATMAEGIASMLPIRGKEILAAVRATAGAIIQVGEEEMWEALQLMARRGAYIEPTSAAAVAGFMQLRKKGELQYDDVVVELTGSGLKATDKLVDLFRQNTP